MSVLVSILITFLVVILVLWLVNRLPLDGRTKQIAQVVVIIIGIISLLRYLAVF
ncbi:Thivi_2564 family membrane protein [Aquamicrobium sp. LC103]|uniref:Thivi_2564 family membrane protein n=1 Tax=Aquamicrobium sp. LC103 TaxID=1120658 RepID=UPI000B300EF5|nr:Thivi_2564 family membrane protein [Aquamicrobium sp. LC103]TKT75670.1 hypothetical protein XW59_017585 [Aquamicrobium sp. LC103]